MATLLTPGDPRLTETCSPVEWPDPGLPAEIDSLHETLASFRKRNGFGRGIAAPQIGILKRFVAINLGATPFALINPTITWRSSDTFEVWDDCLSIPDKIVRVKRHKSISLTYLDEKGRLRHWKNLPPDLSELVQHEIDHLDGILMMDRRVDQDSIRSIEDHAALIGPSRPSHRLSLDAISSAYASLDPVFINSPQYEVESLSSELGCKLTLKIETCNPIRSFKGRGADYFVSRVTARGDSRQMICASAGNFGQALAYACRKHKRPLTIFASVNANPLKIDRMRSLGADVRLEGEDFDAAKNAAKLEATNTGAWMIEDGLESEISEGAGTLGLELLQRGDGFDAAVIPLGNGAMLNGLARWFKAASPMTRILGICASGADATEKSFRTGGVVTSDTVETIADGIAVRMPIPEALDDMRGLVDDILLVDDDAIIEAMQLLYRHAGLLVEPAGAVGVAAALTHKKSFEGQHLATIVCGGNITQDQINQWLK